MDEQKKQLVFIGDSLTEWYSWKRRFSGYRVLNLGISGETVAELLGRRERIRQKVEQPDALFVMSGVNDLANGNYAIFDPYHEFIRNLTTWYKRSTVVVQSILPVESIFVERHVVVEINKQLERIAREQGAVFLDLHALFITADGAPRPGCLSDDGIHLAPPGYAIWSDAVERFLQSREKTHPDDR